MNPVAHASISARMTDYFNRQIAWFERLLADLAPLQDAPGEVVESRLVEQASAHVQGTQTLGQEFWALLKEWETASDISDDERAQVAGLAQQAEVLAQKLSDVYKQGAGLMGNRMNAVNQSLLELRKGRSLLRKYGGHLSSHTTYIDKKA